MKQPIDLCMYNIVVATIVEYTQQKNVSNNDKYFSKLNKE